MSRDRRVGIMGGTFDPIHHGHLVAADEALWRFGLDELLFVPAGQPWQKPVGVSAAEDRYRMAMLASAATPAFAVSRIEIDQPGPTYTVDTLRRLKSVVGDGSRLFFVIGADAILLLETWKDQDQVLGLTEFIVVTRPGFDLATLVERLPTAGGRVHPLAIPALDIYATDIRARVARGAPFRHLVPEPVAAYIERRGLYRGATALGGPAVAPPGSAGAGGSPSVG